MKKIFKTLRYVCCLISVFLFNANIFTYRKIEQNKKSVPDFVRLKKVQENCQKTVKKGGAAHVMCNFKYQTNNF